MTYFAERLRVALAKVSVTGSELSRISGVSPAAVMKWKHGKAYPSSRHLMTIVKTTGCSLDWLMTNAPVDVTSPSQERVEYLRAKEIGHD